MPHLWFVNPGIITPRMTTRPPMVVMPPMVTTPPMVSRPPIPSTIFFFKRAAPTSVIKCVPTVVIFCHCRRKQANHKRALQHHCADSIDRAKMSQPCFARVAPTHVHMQTCMHMCMSGLTVVFKPHTHTAYVNSTGFQHMSSKGFRIRQSNWCQAMDLGSLHPLLKTCQAMGLGSGRAFTGHRRDI